MQKANNKSINPNTLADSLRKLIEFAQQGKQCQRQIFASFNRNDLQKILLNFEQQNTLLRKLSLKLMCVLLSGDSDNVANFCRLFDIPVNRGKIILNKFPTGITYDVPAIINRLKNIKLKVSTQDGPLCYFFEFHKDKVTQIYDYSFKDDQFVDPYEGIAMIPLVGVEQSTIKNMSKTVHMSNMSPHRSRKVEDGSLSGSRKKSQQIQNKVKFS